MIFLKDKAKDNVKDDVKKSAKETAKDTFFKVLRTIRNIFIGLILLIVLVVAGFTAAVKFELLDTEDVAMLNEELGLYRLPFVGNGRYF